VRITERPFSAQVPRDDVAAVLAALLTDRRSEGRILYLSSGPAAIPKSLDEALG
jgi:uncharacterized protein YbjT (DUF2867 family)